MAQHLTYFAMFQHIYPPEIIQVLQDIEISFDTLNYIQHIDAIDAASENVEMLPSKDLGNIIIGIYQDNINSALIEHGVVLIDYIGCGIQMLSDIFKCIVGLGSGDLKEEISHYDPEALETNEYYLATIIAYLLDMEADNIAQHIESVSSTVVNYLYTEVQSKQYINDSDGVYKQRFIKSGITYAGTEIAAYIKNIGHFGYDVDMAFKYLCSPDNDNVLFKEPEKYNALQIAENLWLLALGSDLPLDNLYSKTAQYASLITHDIMFSQRITVELNKLKLRTTNG